MLSPAPFCFFHVLYSISFVQLAAVFQPLLLLPPVYRKNPALTRKMFRFLFCRRKYGILIIQILSCYKLNQIALRLSLIHIWEPLFRWQYLGALVLVCIGIWLVNKAPAKKERAR